MSSNKQPTKFDELRSRYGQTVRWAIANWSVVLSGLALYSGLNALTLIVIARRVDPTEYGQYIASFALASFLVVLPSFGMDAWILTQHREKWSGTMALWTSSLRSRVILLIPWIAVMLLLAAVLPDATYPPEILVPTIFGVAFDSLLFLSFAVLRTRHRHRQVAVAQAAYAISLLGLSLILPIEDGQLAVFAVARMLLSLSAALIMLISLGRRYIKDKAVLTPMRSILSSSRAFMLSELASSVYIKADITIISLVLGTAGTSVYAPAITLLQAAFLIPAALFYVMVPTLSKTYTEDREHFLSRSRAQTWVQVVVGAVISIGTFLLAPFIVDLVYGEAYAESAYILRVLSPIPLIRSIIFALAAVLISSDQQRYRVRAQVVAAVVNVAGSLLVITPYGIIGVAAVYVLSEFVLLVGYAVILQDRVIRKQR